MDTFSQQLKSVKKMLFSYFCCCLAVFASASPVQVTKQQHPHQAESFSLPVTQSRPPPSTSPSSTTFSRFFLIILENKNQQDVLDDPYLGRDLKSRGLFLSDMHAIGMQIHSTMYTLYSQLTTNPPSLLVNPSPSLATQLHSHDYRRHARRHWRLDNHHRRPLLGRSLGIQKQDVEDLSRGIPYRHLLHWRPQGQVC